MVVFKKLKEETLLRSLLEGTILVPHQENACKCSLSTQNLSLLLFFMLINKDPLSRCLIFIFVCVFNGFRLAIKVILGAKFSAHKSFNKLCFFLSDLYLLSESAVEQSSKKKTPKTNCGLPDLCIIKFHF